jgi:hypothetical protein
MYRGEEQALVNFTSQSLGIHWSFKNSKKVLAAR